MKRIILISMILCTLTITTGCNNSSETGTISIYETLNTETITKEKKATIDNYSELLISNFKQLGYFDDVFVKYFEDTNTMVIIPILSNSSSFDTKYTSGSWNNTINEYSNMIPIATSSVKEVFPDANYIVSFSVGNEEMNIPGLIFYNDELVFDYYSDNSTFKEQDINAYMIRQYLWQHPLEEDIDNVKVEYDYNDDTTYTIYLWGKNFNKNSIKDFEFNSVVDNACILSSSLLKLIPSSNIELKIMDGDNHTIELLVIEDYTVDFNYFDDDIDESNSQSENDSENTEKYESGTYKVGDDIPVGEYALFGRHGYFTVESDILYDKLGIMFENIISNDYFCNNSIITVEEGQYLTIDDCYAVPSSLANIDISEEGFFRVGIDIPAGEYKIEQLDTNASYTIYSDNVAGSMNIISEGDVAGRINIKVNDGEYLKLDECKIAN